MIYITKEVEIELDEETVLSDMDSSTVIEYAKDNYGASEILGELDADEVLEHVIDQCTAATILDKISSDDVVEYLTRRTNKHALAALLRKIADTLDIE